MCCLSKLKKTTEVYGPLALMDLNTWNSWVEYVGKYGGYGSDFSNLVQSGKINTQERIWIRFLVNMSMAIML